MHAKVNQNGDFQIWASESNRIPFTSVSDLKGVAEFRFGDDASSLFFKYYQLQLIYKRIVWMHIAPGYRQVFTRMTKKSSKWESMYVPLVDLSLHGCLGGWKISNRTRLLYSIGDTVPDFLVYRNRLRLVTPWRLTRFCFTPYIDDEVFFIEDKSFNQNRFTMGFILPLGGNLSGKLFYRLRHLKLGSDWSHQNILGIGLDFTF